jgi:multidrug efflux pump subunit AcrB
MRAIVEYFVRRHFLVNVMVAAVVLIGVWTALHSQREGFPAITLNQLIVTAQLPGASAAQIERDLAIPIEEAIAELDGVDKYHSVITDNLVITTVEIEDEWSTEQVRVAEGDLRQALDGIHDFPEHMRDRPVIRRVEASKFPILEIALSGPSTALADAAANIEAALADVDGIAKLELVGVEDPELRVLVEPERARAQGVGLDEIMRAIERRNVASTGGVLEVDSDRRQVVLDSRVHAPQDVAQIVVAVGEQGQLVRVADVARLELSQRDQGLRVHTNGEPGVSIVVRKQADADILTTVDEIVGIVEQLELAHGVEAVIVNDASFLTRNRLQLMTSNGIIGMALVIVVLLLFLDLRAAVWVAIGVPVVILGVIAVLSPAATRRATGRPWRVNTISSPALA